MIRAVVDTTVLASGAVSSIGPIADLTDAWIDRRFRLILSERILGELQRALAKPYFTDRLSNELLTDFQLLARSRATIIPIRVEVQGVAPDPEDDHVLSAAVAANAQYLVTGDRALQSLGSYQAIEIVSLREFFNILTANENTGRETSHRRR